MNHRYPTRALNINSGEQLLQKRTRSTLQKPDGKSAGPNENSTSKKARTKDQDNLDSDQHYSVQYAEQVDTNSQDKYQRAMSANTKANPRMVNAQMMNPRQGKQLFKDQQPNFMATPQAMWPQNQYMQPQMMNMNPFGMQMAMMQPMQQMQQMQQMSQMYPQMANPGFSQPDTSAQIADLQMKLYSLQQQAAAKDQMQQMQAYHQFQTPMMNMGQPGMFQPNMMAQQVPLDQDSQYTQGKKSSKSPKRSKSPSARQSPLRRQSQSPESKSHAKQGPAKSKKGKLSNTQKKVEPIAAQTKNMRSVKIQDKSKIAPKSTAGKKSPVKFEGNKTPTRLQKSSQEKNQKPSSNKSSLSPFKSKLSQSNASVRDEEQMPFKRSTRIQAKTFHHEKKVAQKQAVKKQGNVTPIKDSVTDVLPPRTLRSSQTNKADAAAKKVKKVSPVRTSPRKTVAKHTRSYYQHPDTVPVRQTRLRSRVAQKSPSKAHSESAAVVERSNISSTQEQSNILKNLQKEINTAKDDLQKLDKSKHRSGSRSSEKKKEQPRPPTQDEIMLFGESSFPQNEANPLICSKKKFEAQTEIVVAQKTIEGFGNEPVFTDEEEDQEMKVQLAKEKEFLQKQNEIKQLEKEIIPQEKMKDMSQLFGMPEEELVEIAEKQKDKLQKIKDEQKLFGEELAIGVKEFSHSKSQSANEPQVVKEEQVAPQKATDENMLFGEQPSQQKPAQILEIQESQVSDKVSDKVFEKVQEVQEKPEQVVNDDEDLLFGSQQKQTVLSNVQEETPQDNSDSFNIKVQQNSPQDSKPVSSDQVKQIHSTQQSEYLKKQDELDRQIAEIKRQIALQTEKAKTIENDIVLSQQVSQPVPETAANDDQEMIEDSQQVVEVEQPLPQNEDKEMEEVQAQTISEDEVQEVLQESIEEIESQPVIHKNYKQSLKLTDKFQLLYEFQNSLDVAMNMILIKNQSPTFSNLKNIIQLQTKRQFNMSHFQQLVNLEPNSFNHRWESKMGKMELIITHPSNVDAIAQTKWNTGVNIEPSSLVFQGRISSQTIDFRQKIIKNDLIKFMADELERNYADSNFNSYSQDQWPAFFNFDDIEDIELGQLKEQPKVHQKTTIKDFLKENDTKTQVMKVMEQVNQRQQPSIQVVAPVPQRQENHNDISQLSPSSSESSDRDSSEEARKRSHNYNTQTGISQNTLDAIHLKQKLEQEQKETQEAFRSKQNTQMKIEMLSKVAEHIRSIFEMQPGSTIFLAKLLERLTTTAQSGSFVSKVLEQLRDQIIELTKACPKWIQLVNNMQGTLVKLHQNMNLASYHLKQNIKDYLINKQNGNQQPLPVNPRSTKSLPPPQQKQGAVSQGIQIYHKPQQGFQPYPRQQPGSHSQDQRKNVQISQLSASNEQNQQLSSRKNSGVGPSIQNQNMYHMRQNSNYNQYMHQQQQQMNQNKIINNTNHQQQNTQQAVNNSVGISSSSGTFLSGPALHDGGEASLGTDQHMPSKYLSPSLKQSHGGNKSSGYRNEGIGGLGIQFGNDMYQGMQSNSHRSVSSYGQQGYPQGNQHFMENQQQFYRNQNHKY